ncbi:MAG: hypothetical protein AAF681_14530, partial [Pseudomonadota bacterium]
DPTATRILVHLVAFGNNSIFSQLFEGASYSLWFAGAQVTGTVVISLLSIRLGTGGLVSRADGIVLAFAGLGLIAWYVTETAIYALAITISINLLGGAVTLIKAFKFPTSETVATWFLSFLGAIFAVLALGTIDWVLLAYPLYLFALNGAIVVAILLGRRRNIRRNATA